MQLHDPNSLDIVLKGIVSSVSLQVDARGNSAATACCTCRSCDMRRNPRVHSGVRDAQIYAAVLLGWFALGLVFTLSLPTMVAWSSLRARTEKRVSGCRYPRRVSDFYECLVHHDLARPLN